MADPKNPTKCPECGTNANLTPDGSYAHCTGCNTTFEPAFPDKKNEGFSSHPDYKPDEHKKSDDGASKDGKS